MSEVSRIGGADLIYLLRTRDWAATPEEVKALATEIVRLRDVANHADLIDGKTVVRVEINLDEWFDAWRHGRLSKAPVFTGPDRIEQSKEMGVAIAEAVESTMNEWFRKWHEFCVTAMAEEE